MVNLELFGTIFDFKVQQYVQKLFKMLQTAHWYTVCHVHDQKRVQMQMAVDLFVYSIIAQVMCVFV